MQTTYDSKVILHRAGRYPPRKPQANASSFANWVYKLSHNPERESGEYQDDKRKSQSSPFTFEDGDVVAGYLARERDDEQLGYGWTLVYADPGDEIRERFFASRLIVDDERIRCRPDAVMRHDATGEILIIERKITTKFDCQIPTHSWPNVRAQLWCYAWIDDWADAPKITLMDEIWRRNATTAQPVPPRVRRFWDRRDELFQRENEELFLKYGGRIEGGKFKNEVQL